MSPGSRSELTFSIAGLCLRVHSRDVITHPDALDGFRTDEVAADVEFGFERVLRLSPFHSPVIYEGASHWRARADNGELLYEMFYPRTAEVYCQMTGNQERSAFSVVFGRENLATFPGRGNHFDVSAWFPYPLDQLAVTPALARHDGVLVHACGGVLDGKAYVFAGHSGDGKTTLSRLLATEGVELLSDERIAIRHQHGRLIAYGTPWHGEGSVVSPASYPLGGVFVLKKAPEHRVNGGHRATLAAELLSRCIVPYYLPEETALILALVERIAGAVPLYELEFSRDAGLPALLAEFARTA